MKLSSKEQEAYWLYLILKEWHSNALQQGWKHAAKESGLLLSQMGAFWSRYWSQKW